MALKFIGGCGIVLGLLLLLAAFAQPATVTETSTTCVDTTYYGQDCSTVEYERPNQTRSQLFGGGTFFLVSELTTYGIGAARSGNSLQSTEPSTPKSSSVGTDATDDRRTDAMTLREQLDAKTNPERTADTDPSVRTDSVDTVGETTLPTAGPSAESTRSASGRGLSAFLKPIASGLAAAFVLTWLLSGAFVVESPVGRAVVFAICSLPGIGLYTRYSSDESAVATPATEGSDR
ncbi:hypothetical protein JMJ58_02950 [Haloterrigena salifodinae]|uniref:Uncharacterized protein n=1 Tax=Haloterrigena salifodinae TaxID=2675099 RepID=A0A8T8E287_9EURY|nr:hypothetical protein [Haloterrigena salifodinae]QRV15878.1 hypothetical protein JMJ58_02950 [Haloterrigena salifodinae]